MPQTVPTDCLYYLISRATLAVTAVLKRGFAEAGVAGIRPSYLGVLLSLWEEDNLQALELGRRAGLEPSSMTGVLDRMERDGLIARRPDPADRRAQRIGLTAAGRKARAPVTRVVDQTLARVSGGLDERQVERIKDALRTVLANAQEERR